MNGKRDQSQPEYELFDALKDTFLANRYFDVFIEYAKAGPEDMLCRITAINRGPDAAPIHLLPHLWYRNRWSWDLDGKREVIRAIGPGAASTTHHGSRRSLVVRASVRRPDRSNCLFTENETNFKRIDNVPNKSPYVKDGINNCVVERPEATRVNAQQGSKLAGHAHAVVPAGGTFSVDVRFSPAALAEPFADFDAVFTSRIAEADAFYAALHPPTLGADEQLVGAAGVRGTALVEAVLPLRRLPLAQRRSHAAAAARGALEGRNSRWKELHNADVILMPDTWEYPWYASWDLAFHCVAMAHIDPEFAKEQLRRMGYEWYQHANGQFPAYEWNFDDVNPPVTGWAAWRVYQIDRDLTGARRHRVPQGNVSERDAEFQLLGQPQRQQRAATSSAAASWAWTTSACSTATSRCPTAASSNRATAPVGWRSIRITMLTIAAELAQADPILPEHGDQVLRALPLHRPRDDEHRRGGDRPVGPAGPVFLRRDPAPVGREHSAADPLDGRPGAAVRRVRRLAHQGPRARHVRRAGAVVCRASARSVEERRPGAHAGREQHAS